MKTNPFLSYLEEDNGESIIDFGDIGFLAYYKDDKTKVMFVTRLFISKDHRGSKENLQMMKEVTMKKAIEMGLKVMESAVYLKECNKETFTKRLSTFDFFGFAPTHIEGNSVIVRREL